MIAINWRYIDKDGLPALDLPVLVYRPTAHETRKIGGDVRKEWCGGKFSHTRPDTPVVAWVPISEVMETIR